MQHPSKRVGKPEDIARMCLFLCQDENDFINGENITIDGGMTKKMIYTEQIKAYDSFLPIPSNALLVTSTPVFTIEAA